MRRTVSCLIGLIVAATAVSPQQPTGGIRGTVADELRSVPFHAATIELRGEGIRRVVQAGGDGFRISGVPAGVYELGVSESFYFPMTIRSVHVKAGEVRVLPPLELVFGGVEDCHHRVPIFLRVLDQPPAGKGSVGGTVVDDRGRTLADARVRLYIDNAGFTGSGITDTEGRFSISDAPAGNRYRIEIAHDGYYTEEFSDFTVQSGYETVYDPLSLEPCESGRCVPSLRPVRPMTGCFGH